MWKLQIYQQNGKHDGGTRQTAQAVHARSSAGLDSLRVLSKCSCMNSLIIQCLNAFTMFYSSAGVKCGKLAKWEV